MDFKPFYDRVQTAQAKKQSILNAMNTALQLGTPEGDETAAEMEAQLDAAISEEEKAVALYNKVVAAAKGPNVNEKFVPASETPADPEEEGVNPKEMTFSEYQALQPRERLAFAKSGGQIK